MTTQQAFNVIVTALRKQNAKSVLDTTSPLHEGNCQYRGKDGTKCAAGWLIPDEIYVKEMEGLLIE